MVEVVTYSSRRARIDVDPEAGTVTVTPTRRGGRTWTVPLDQIEAVGVRYSTLIKRGTLRLLVRGADLGGHHRRLTERRDPGALCTARRERRPAGFYRGARDGGHPDGVPEREGAAGEDPAAGPAGRPGPERLLIESAQQPVPGRLDARYVSASTGLGRRSQNSSSQGPRHP